MRGGAGASVASAHPLRDARGLRGGEVQPQLGAAPQRVLGGAGPLRVHHVSQLRLGEAAAEGLAEVGHAARVREDGPRACPVGPRQAVRQGGGQPGVAAPQVAQEAGEVAAGQVAAGQGGAAGPGGGAGCGQVGQQPVQRVLGEAAVGGDLAAEHREHRRGRGAQLQHVVAGDGGGVGGAVVVQRAHAREAVHHVRGPHRRAEVSPHGAAEVLDLRRARSPRGRGRR